MIEHCTDFRRIKHLCDWPICLSPDYYYLIEVQDGKDVGVWLFHPYKNEMIVHVEFLKGYRGPIAAKSGRKAFEWLFNHNSVNIIYAAIPLIKKEVQMLASVVGFKFNYCDEKFRWYGLSRPEMVV